MSLSENAAVHATKVLRMKEGETIILFNGDGADYKGEILSIRKNDVNVKLKSAHACDNESPLDITLLQAISSGDRMDFTIQKAVELGIKTIQPIASQRSVVKLSGDRLEKRREHWQHVAIAACEQSGRAYVPQVAAPSGLAEWLSTHPKNAGIRIMLAPLAEHTLAQLPKPTGPICLLIGAEGGLSPDEISLATLHHFQGVRLGTRILRTETAALAALSAMHTLWGDFS